MQNKLNEFLDSSAKEMIELQTLLTKHPAIAPENGGEGELKKCEALVAWLKAHGITNIERYDAPDSRVESGVRPNVVATIKGASDDYAVWVMAHMDVVPIGEASLWQTDPWTVVEKDGKIFGRGVEDNQQGLVSGVFATLSFLKNNITPAHTVKLLFISDEEVGSKYGIQYLLANHKLFKKEDIIVIPDGGDAKGETIEVAEKNILWLRIKVSGKQAHGSQPNNGANACLAACDLSLRLHNLENVFDKKDELFEPNYSTFSPTMRDANVGSINIIPGEDVFCMDCRVLPCYSVKEVLEKVDELCRNVEVEHGVKISYEKVQAEESPATPVDSPVVKKLSSALKKTRNITPRIIGIGGGTVGAYLRKSGYDAVVWSTLDEMMHQVNEYCVVKNMIEDAKTLAALFLE